MTYHHASSSLVIAARALVVTLAFGFVTLGANSAAALFEALFAPRADLWPYWTAHDETSARTVDHGAWSAFLSAYLVMGDDGIRRVAYDRVTADDRAALKAYVARLAAVVVSDLNRREQLAYWINLYNALTVDVVLDHYPVASIRNIDISPGLFARGPWDKKLVTVEGEKVSLNDIEHRILRPIWRDARIHYAVNCASLGCPDLATTAYTSDMVEAMLEEGAKAYINHPRGARVEGGRLTVSSIYSWFEEDFGSERGVLDHLRRYAAPPLAAALEGVGRIDAYAYDWALNDVPAR